MIQVLRRPSPTPCGRKAKRQRHDSSIAVVIATQDGSEDGLAAHGVVYLSCEAGYLERGLPVQDHISQDPKSAVAAKIASIGESGRQRKGATHFRQWCPPVAARVESRIVFVKSNN